MSGDFHKRFSKVERDDENEKGHQVHAKLSWLLKIICIWIVTIYGILSARRRRRTTTTTSTIRASSST